MPNFTTEDLLLFMYNEMSDQEKAALEQELQNNWALREKLQVLKDSEKSLQKVKTQAPRAKTIEAIMDYASATQEEGAANPNNISSNIEYLWIKDK
jgi:hypothetical protein